ncbi:hypothetical protein PZ895_13085 [Mesorhizobium sp. YIM 152430]|uniref:hypothetical protein n=1 Tax=Mesorhizobium sp. YIM 152430 TaxID=3031761 RepID=UPI0023DACAE3|nr:hypothetical protein [Mesorhizobium sp. YIM 152430]MDF1600698.1 hypothetical protein [Mesorhizobium sp. YIM 152430]
MARRRKSKSGKWIVTGALTAALAGGAYLWLGDDAARRLHDAAQNPPVKIERPIEKKAVRPPAKVQRAALPKASVRQGAKPVAPAAMPVDRPRKIAVPRPSLAVRN